MENSEDTLYILSESPEGVIYLDTKLLPDYLMGDPEYDYFSDAASFSARKIGGFVLPLTLIGLAVR